MSSAAVDAPFFALARYQVERPDYSFSPITPLSMPVGGSTATTVTVNSIEDFTSPVRLHISGLPDGTELRPGFSASINGGPNQVQLTPPLDGSASATLTMGAGVTVVPGPYSFFVVSDDDSPGHPHSLFFQVNVTTSLTTAASVVTAFETAGAIDNHGVAIALQTKLAHAQESSDAGDVESAENTLGAFMNQVKAQSGKHIATTATINGVTFSPPAVLLEHARDLLAHLKTQNVPNPVTGYVTTSTHGEVPDAVVSILDPTNTVVATATTDSTGFYYVANTSVLTPGTRTTRSRSRACRRVSRGRHRRRECCSGCRVPYRCQNSCWSPEAVRGAQHRVTAGVRRPRRRCHTPRRPPARRDPASRAQPTTSDRW